MKSVRFDSAFLGYAVGSRELVGFSAICGALNDLHITSGPVAK